MRLLVITFVAVTVGAGPVAVSAAAPTPVRHHAITNAAVHTGWAALDRAIAKIPSYDPRVAHWHVQDRGYWGATNLDTGDIYIAPRAPLDKLVSIVLHKYGHALAGYLYDGRLPAQIAADRYFGQLGGRGLKVEADCMARVQGATWTWYTLCANSHWRDGARRLLAHNLLPPHQEAGDVRAGQRAQPEDTHRQQRCLRPQFDGDEADVIRATAAAAWSA